MKSIPNFLSRLWQLLGADRQLWAADFRAPYVTSEVAYKHASATSRKLCPTFHIFNFDHGHEITCISLRHEKSLVNDALNEILWIGELQWRCFIQIPSNHGMVMGISLKVLTSHAEANENIWDVTHGTMTHCISNGLNEYLTHFVAYRSCGASAEPAMSASASVTHVSRTRVETVPLD